MKESFSGIFGVYKPKGPTSHDIINKIRKITGEKRVGHAGTLDPLASGVLVIAIGRPATKELKEFVLSEKEYIATIRLGAQSETDDEEGNKTIKEIRLKPKIDEIKKTLKKFQGVILQTPPIYSALKINGKRAYKIARSGRDIKDIKLKPREVEIKSIKILKYKWPDLKIKVITGPGVYIRSLARNIGEHLKTGGYLKELERIRVGQFIKKETTDINKLPAN
ncbi:MAG: tRNA pseudouridine(55) synthase TruB [Patescibacteria group bacterium]